MHSTDNATVVFTGNGALNVTWLCQKRSDIPLLPGGYVMLRKCIAFKVKIVKTYDKFKHQMTNYRNH